jgi:hypothetical protein
MLWLDDVLTEGIFWSVVGVGLKSKLHLGTADTTSSLYLKAPLPPDQAPRLPDPLYLSAIVFTPDIPCAKKEIKRSLKKNKKTKPEIYI